MSENTSSSDSMSADNVSMESASSESRDMPDSTQQTVTAKRRSTRRVDAVGSVTSFPRGPQPVNCSRCRYKCTEKISQPRRYVICRAFHCGDDVTEQTNFIRSHVIEAKPKTITTDARDHRMVSRFYYLPTDDNHVTRVCCKFFCKTLDVTTWRMEKWLKTTGRHGNGSVNEDCVEQQQTSPTLITDIICRHISMFPTYRKRNDKQAKYLEADLSVDVMYDHFKQFWTCCLTVDSKSYSLSSSSASLAENHVGVRMTCPTDVDIPHLTQYKAVFQDFHLRFFTGLSSVESSEQQWQRLDEEFRVRQYDQELLVVNVQLRDYLVLPSVADFNSPLVYCRKLFVYHVTLEDSHGRRVCYLWSEIDGRYGVNELGSVLCRYLHDVITVTSTTSKVCFFVTSSTRSFQRRRLAALLLYVINTMTSLTRVDIKFVDTPLADNDCLQLAVNHARQYLSLFVVHDWVNVIKAASRERPYEVRQLNASAFVDLKTLEHDVCLASKCLRNEMEWCQVMWLCVDRSADSRVLYKKSIWSPEFEVIDLSQHITSLSVMHPVYKTSLSITLAKKNDLLALCSSNVIPDIYHNFYNTLPASCDILFDVIEAFSDEQENDVVLCPNGIIAAKRSKGHVNLWKFESFKRSQ